MLKVGITGQAGFIGTHLYNTLGLKPDQFTRMPFEDAFFKDLPKLEEWVETCDVIVHLAAMNRHNDPEVIYHTNIGLVNQLIDAMEKTNVTPHVLFASSTQEERDNLYGKSKREGRELFERWARRNNASFTGLVIPNVFGPFGNPYYNSVIATFCHQLTHNETPKIEIDGEIRLIYIGELVEVVIEKIKDKSEKIKDKSEKIKDKSEKIKDKSEKIKDKSEKTKVDSFQVPHTAVIRVTELLKLLLGINVNYFDKGEIPDLDNPFNRNLFNTFLTYIDHPSFFPSKLKLNKDNRGSFVETVKLNSGGQVSFSTTVPGITRGNHFHTRKVERFAVIKGKARIELRKIGTTEVLSFELDGTQPSFVDMPVWYTHNITNIGEEELYTIFWINEHFDTSDPDTYFEKV